MNSGPRRSPLSYIPGLSNNAVLQLIIASGVAFVTLGVSWGIIKIVYQGDETNFNQYFISNIALPALPVFKHHWWTLLTYGWFSFSGFWDLLSNMLWLYCFGSLVQMLLGHRQIIPLFIYSLIAGGACYLAAQALPGEWGKIPHVVGMLGPRAGLMGMAAAAVTLTPNYRFYLTETFRIHILVVAGVFTLLMVMASGFYISVLLMLAGGALMGYAYIKLLKAGYRPGAWMYDIVGRAESLVTPGHNASLKSNSRKRAKVLSSMYESRNGISQQRIDDILDKINQKGYGSLSSEEKDILMRAAKEK